MPTPLLPPVLFLLILLAITGLVWTIEHFQRQRRQRHLIELAREWGMQFSPDDVLGIGDRLAAHLPIIGAADVRVSDLVYGTEQAGRAYLFSAEYTAGVVRTKSRQRCVVFLLEPKNSGGDADWSSLRIAPTDRPLIEQYRSLKQPITLPQP